MEAIDRQLNSPLFGITLTILSMVARQPNFGQIVKQ
jgi:hypothetical protein